MRARPARGGVSRCAPWRHVRRWRASGRGHRVDRRRSGRFGRRRSGSGLGRRRRDLERRVRLRGRMRAQPRTRPAEVAAVIRMLLVRRRGRRRPRRRRRSRSGRGSRRALHDPRGRLRRRWCGRVHRRWRGRRRSRHRGRRRRLGRRSDRRGLRRRSRSGRAGLCRCAGRDGRSLAGRSMRRQRRRGSGVHDRVRDRPARRELHRRRRVRAGEETGDYRGPRHRTGEQDRCHHPRNTPHSRRRWTGSNIPRPRYRQRADLSG
jgi:hypothetical protein